ncbi:MAG: SpoIID/LytB domain-containing protein [Candidatus Obscuribacterales bacterium]
MNNMNLSVTAKDTCSSAASDDEMAAIAAAVQAYLLQEQELELSDNNSVPSPTSSLSPWAVASRREASGTSSNSTSWGLSDRQIWSKGKLWGSSLAVAISLAVANLLTLSAPAQAADKQIRVCLSTSTTIQRVDLDFPDGGSVYSVADGTLVGKIAPQSAWSLNLARSATKGNSSIVFLGKSSRDRISPASTIAKAAFVPSTGSFFGTTSDSNQLALPLVAPIRKGGVTASSSSSSSSSAIDASQGYIAVPDQVLDQVSNEGNGREPSSVPLIGVNGKLYRGAVVLRPVMKTDSNGVADTTGINLINVLDLEDYLLSVVPSEVPSLWPKEVLKAQAIAARSYAVANFGKHRAEGYDVKATVDDQVYRGVIAESAETNAAVAATSGLVLKNSNKVISAFFHSTSGGSTEVSENVWGKPLPYLKSVVDYDDAAPQFTWRKTITSQDLAKALLGSAQEAQVLLGVLVIGRHPGDSQRVKDVLVVGQNSARVIAGTELRRLFNLPSTQFSLFQSDSSYIFSGRGYGHGLGLSQWGAKALADNGYNAEQILSYYYKDVTIEPLAPEGAI